MITIESAQNGWIVTEWDDTDDEAQPVPHVIEEDEDPGAQEIDADASARLLWLLVDLLGVRGSRYDEKRVRVRVEPGDKYGDCAPVRENGTDDCASEGSTH